MIDIIIHHNLTSKDIGHHWNAINKELGYKKRVNGGMKNICYKPHEGGRHPFNIITKEIVE